MRPPTAQELATFERLCGSADASATAALRQAVKQHLGELQLAAKRNELIAIDLAQDIATKLDALLAQLPELTETAQHCVVGAARYFVSYEDALPDLHGPLGLDDDVAIFNLAARRILRPDLEIAE